MLFFGGAFGHGVGPFGKEVEDCGETFPRGWVRKLNHQGVKGTVRVRARSLALGVLIAAAAGRAATEL